MLSASGGAEDGAPDRAVRRLHRAGEPAHRARPLPQGAAARRRQTVGRLDSRFTATDVDAAGETEEFDPSNTALQGAYTALFSDYVRTS